MWNVTLQQPTSSQGFAFRLEIGIGPFQILLDFLATLRVPPPPNEELGQPRSQGPVSSSLEKVPWLRLVTCLSIQIQSSPSVGLWLNCVYGGESCFALQTLFWKLSKLFVRDPAWPVFRFYLNFYEYEMLIETEVCFFSLRFLNNRQQPVLD